MGMTRMLSLLPITILLLMMTTASGSRILLLPLPWPSVINELSFIGKELVSRGHEVNVLLPEDYFMMERFTSSYPSINVIPYASKYPALFVAMDDPTDMYDIYAKDSTEVDFRVDTDGLLNQCKNVLEDKAMEEKIMQKKFDMVLLSGFPECRCYFVLPYRLDIPYISVTTELESWVTRNPALPSFVPVHLQSPPLTTKMDFWQRLQNFRRFVGWPFYIDQVPMASDDLVATYAPNKPAVSMNYVAGKALLWLYDNDILVDYPRPLMPNEIDIGGLSLESVKPLSQELERFVSSAKSGVIVATFGSIAIIPEHLMLRILDGLKLVSKDYHIIVRWHITKSPKPSVPENIMLMEYVPQNYILAHPNTKLFVTHCGANGHFEALAHAVPMVNIPVIYDQIYNDKRVDYHGFSKTINLKNFTAQELASTIQHVVSDPSYKEKISHASAIFHSRPMSPRERAAFWVEHVIQYGGTHLRAHALDMPAYQYLMLDIAAFVGVLFVAGLWATFSLMKVLKRMAGF